MIKDNVIFREYDIRGVYEKEFDLEFAEQLGKALVSYVHKKNGSTSPKITLGHDARLSSPAIVKALSKGITSSGGQSILLGLITTPISYFSTFTMDKVEGAIMVTGSHNPPEYNGFKLSFGTGSIFGSEIQALKTIIDEGDFLTGDGNEQTYNIFPPYVERYKNEFGDLGNLPVVIDCGNGAAGCIVRELYESVGLNPTFLFEEPDGRFPNHHPDPTVAENLVDLIKAVKEEKALCGIGFDGDADRIGLVDHEGTIIYGDQMMALFAKDILASKPGEKIIGDVKCSDNMYDYIEKYNGKGIMWKTGHSLVKEKIKKEKSPFGGELSGHIFFADRNYGYDDSLYAGLRIIEILKKSGKSIKELLADYPEAYNTPELRIDTTEEKKHSIVARLKEEFAKDTDEYKINLIDGIRVSFADGWALARASNTQPVLVLRFESTSEAGLKRIKDKFESIVNPLL